MAKMLGVTETQVGFCFELLLDFEYRDSPGGRIGHRCFGKEGRIIFKKIRRYRLNTRKLCTWRNIWDLRRWRPIRSDFSEVTDVARVIIGCPGATITMVFMVISVVIWLQFKVVAESWSKNLARAFHKNLKV